MLGHIPRIPKKVGTAVQTIQHHPAHLLVAKSTRRKQRGKTNLTNKDAAGGDPEDIIIDQALETDDAGTSKPSQHLDLGRKKVRPIRFNVVQLQYHFLGRLDLPY